MVYNMMIPGLGGGGRQGTTLAGQTTQISNGSGNGTIKPTTYDTAAEIRDAFNAGDLTESQACDKLMNQFGYSGLECQDYLVTEALVIPDGYYVVPTGPPVFPGDFDGDGIPNLYDSDHYVADDPNAPSVNGNGNGNGDDSGMDGWTANQWHIIIGIIVVAIIYQYYWKRGA